MHNKYISMALIMHEKGFKKVESDLCLRKQFKLCSMTILEYSLFEMSHILRIHILRILISSENSLGDV